MEKSLKSAIAQAPDRLDLYERLAALEARSDDSSRAIRVLDTMVKKNPDAPRANVIRGAYLLNHRHLARAKFGRREDVLSDEGPPQHDTDESDPEKNIENRDEESVEPKQDALLRALDDAHLAR